MKKVAALVLIGLLATTGLVHAEAKPVQLSLFDPIQMVPADESIKGLSLNLFYVVNQDVTGLSYSFLGVNRAKGNVEGIQLGLGNWVDGDMFGWQPAFVSRTGKRFVGWQGGIAAVTEGDFTGLQTGLVSWTEGFFHGAQLGLVNYGVGRFIGFQGGLVNITKGQASGLDLGVVNWADGSFKGIQAGLFNYANEVHGLQLGFGNYAKSLDGVQIGLGNYNGKKEPFEFLPIVNWSF